MLEMEADFKALQVVYNSLRDNKMQRQKVRSQLCPNFGNFHPLFSKQLQDSDNIEQIKEVLQHFSQYKNMLNDLSTQVTDQTSNQKTIEDCMYKEEVQLHSLCFDQQANIGILYAYVKLKE